MKLWMKMSPPLMAAVLLMGTLIIIAMNSNFYINNEIMLILEWELITLNGMTIFIPLLIDKISLIFSSIVMLISFSVMLFSTSYMSADKNLEYFIIMVMMFIMSMNLLIFFPNMISLLMGWDGLGLSSYLLVIYYLNDKSMAAGMITALTNRIGDSLLILASSWAFISGQWNFWFSSYSVTSFVMMAMMVAAMTKSAQLPFSAWLPAAMAAPTPVSALVHSSTLVTAGIYLMIRFFPSLSLFNYFQHMCLYTGMMTCMMASAAASMESDLKKMIALSTLSQLGVMMMALGLNQPMLAFFHLITHALFKALLFICAGNIIHSMNNNQDIRLMGNISLLMPMTTTMLNIANMSLCGLPFMAGFYSKDFIVEIFMISNTTAVISLMMMMSICMTSFYTMKLSLMTLWSPFKGNNIMSINDQSKLSMISYSLLLSGAIMSGSLLSWLLNPSMTLLILPPILKLLTLTMITLLAILMYFMLKNSKTLLMTHFLSSMWFLSLLSAPPITLLSMMSSKMINYNEMTWMETCSGKGMKSTTKKSNTKMQKSSDMPLSSMMSSMAFISIMMILYNY